MTNKTRQYKMWLMTTTLLITSAVNYCNAEIENQRTSIAQFDTGMNVQELMDAQSQTNKLPQPAYLSPSFSGRYSRITRDCRYIEFGPNSSLTSGQVFLESRFYEEVCHTVGGNHGGGHSGGGNHGGGYNDGSYHGRCGGVNLYGKYYHGGGCNAFGCWRADGGCNAYGCWRAGGGCNAYGCWRPGGSCHFAGCVGKWHGNSEPCNENEYDNDRDPSGGHQGDGYPGSGNGHNNGHDNGYQGNHGGYNNHPQTYCEERLVHTERRSVQMEVNNRGQIFPWEKDVFQVCLRGQDFQVDVMENASHTYDFSVNGHYDLRVTAMAGAKIPTRPDPNGIFVEGFVYEPGSRNFKVSLQDRWAGYYGGERTGITLKLKKDRRLWGDEQILSKEMLLPAQERYEVNFASFAGEFSKPLESGQKYYVEWSFRRMGSVSKPVNNEGGQTSRITLP